MKTIKTYPTNRDFDPEHEGTIDDPYTYQEFLDLFNFPPDHSRWRGGFVEGYDYIPRNVIITAGKIIVVNGLYEDMTNFPEYLYEDLVPLNYQIPVKYPSEDEDNQNTQLDSDFEDPITTMTCEVEASITAYLLTINVKLIAMPFDNPFLIINNVVILKKINGHTEECDLDEANSIVGCEYDGTAKVNLPLDGNVEIFVCINYNFEYTPDDGSPIEREGVVAEIPVNIKR